MRLIYYRPPHGNFGDDLNAVLWPALAPDIFQAESDQGFLGIGTIVGMQTPGVTRLNVFSSGVGYDPLDRWTIDRRVWCVRGPLTARALCLEPRAALTDGAVLAPQLLAGAATVEPAGVAVMPDWTALKAPGWDEACALVGFELIDPRREPLAVIERVRRSRLLLTSSLHGAIVADALDVPWIMFAASGNFTPFKFYDWCASVETPLAPVVLAPPSARAWVPYGRSTLAPEGGRPVLDAEFAWADFGVRMRLGVAYERRGNRHSLGVLLKNVSQRIGLPDTLLGLSPARTAEGLSAMAAMEPMLSRPERRQRLAAEMLDRLEALRGRAALREAS